LPASLGSEERVVSRLLYDRLGEDDAAELRRRVTASPELEMPAPDTSDPTQEIPFLLAYGMWLRVPSVADKTGLTYVQPPDDVHAMARGPLAAAGGIYEADMVVDALLGVGIDAADLRTAVDFGCSSGRVVRVLAAAYPGVTWLGCDPNETAVAWAREHLVGIDFFVSSQEPPLPFDDDSLDLVYAISIWSHFAPALGLRWFKEMHRVIRRGGHLVFTTHGLTSIAFFTAHGYRTPEKSSEIMRALYRCGWSYAADFGAKGDWGVVSDEWGTSFLTPEWVLTNLCPHWRVEQFAPGRNQENQDVYVLARV
jgi:SAM-dependent methyltransferase